MLCCFVAVVLLLHCIDAMRCRKFFRSDQQARDDAVSGYVRKGGGQKGHEPLALRRLMGPERKTRNGH